MLRTAALIIVLLHPLSLFATGHNVSAGVHYGPINSSAVNPLVAFSSKHFLTIWQTSLQVAGSLADPARGDVTPSFPVLPYGSVTSLQLAPAGDGFLVVWSDFSGARVGNLTSEGILSRQTQLDAGVLVTPRMAFNGSNIVIVDRPNTTAQHPAMEASTYDRDGKLLRRIGMPVSVNDAYAVVDADGEFQVATAGQSGIHVFRIGGDGAVLSDIVISPPPVLGHATFEIALASSNHHTAVAWVPLGGRGGSMATIDPNGVAASPTVLPSSGAILDKGIGVLKVDTGFVIIWTEYSPLSTPSIFASRLDQDGRLMAGEPFKLGSGVFRSGASSGGMIDAAISSIGYGNAVAMVTARVDASGIVTQTAQSSPLSPVLQSAQSLTTDGVDFLATWVEFSSTSYMTFAGRVSRTGDALDGAGIKIDDRPSQTFGVIARGPGSQSLAVRSTNQGIFATRLSPMGATIDAMPIKITDSPNAGVAVAWNGSRYLVIWPAWPGLLGSFVGTDGSVTAPLPLVSLPVTANEGISAPAIAWDGYQYLVAYSVAPAPNVLCSPPCGPGLPNKVRVMRVSAGGSPLDAAPVTVPGTHIRAHIASSGSEFLVVLDSLTGVSAVTVREDRASTTLGNEVTLFHWTDSASSDVVWDGSTYLAGWRYTFSSLGGNWLGAAHVSRSGQMSPPLFTATGRLQGGTSIAANDAGQTALLVSEAAPPADDIRARIYFASELEPMPPPPLAPRNVISYFAGNNTARIDWQSDVAIGFLVERSVDFGKSWSIYSTLAGNSRTTTAFAMIGYLFRISAFGPGGLSQPTITSIASQQRHHASH